MWNVKEFWEYKVGNDTLSLGGQESFIDEEAFK